MKRHNLHTGCFLTSVQIKIIFCKCLVHCFSSMGTKQNHLFKMRRHSIKNILTHTETNVCVGIIRNYVISSFILRHVAFTRPVARTMDWKEKTSSVAS